MQQRERDGRGRPLNARPRDGLGRPLPRGAEGVARVPEEVLLTPADAIAEAQRLLDEGMPFHAHEVLEGSWKAAPDSERELWQGLAQLAVGLTHLLRGNIVGAQSLLRRGQDRIRGFETGAPHGLDVTGLVAWSQGVLDGLAGAGSEMPVPSTPRLLRRGC
ncbi:DUF309 domain-containing protein [Rhodococcus oryzae]|uniref:DUF309 domain-containing protein n=1 Tax=Rhodococcus oryzae TaxID=2571143 RepID=A0ABY2RPD6_9NOCA|nr:DUF309 domain-containing protein [Rhodococcus oryzae]TJZ79644.1 DUF309 domain-containing protein [Rhodococcus oryzae]